MSEFWPVLLALVAGAAGGAAAAPLVGRASRAGRRLRAGGRSRAGNRRVRELLGVVGELDRGLAAVLNLGPLNAAELAQVDLLGRADRLAGGGHPALAGAVVDQLRQSVETIVSHPFPAQDTLRAALPEANRELPVPTLWVLVRDAAGSGAAQHAAARLARGWLAQVRVALEGELEPRVPAARLSDR